VSPVPGFAYKNNSFHGLSPVANNTGPSRAVIRQPTVTIFAINRLRPVRVGVESKILEFSTLSDTTSTPTVTTYFARFETTSAASLLAFQILWKYIDT